MNLRAKPFILLAAGACGVTSMIYLLGWIHRIWFLFGGTTFTTPVLATTFVCGLVTGGWPLARLADRAPQSSWITFAVIDLSYGVYGPASVGLLRLIAWDLSAHSLLSGHLEMFVIGSLILIALAIFVLGILIAAIFCLLARIARVGWRDVGDAVGWVFGANACGAAVGVALMVYGALPTPLVDQTPYCCCVPVMAGLPVPAYRKLLKFSKIHMGNVAVGGLA